MREDNKINVLIIHADQHRYDCLGAYGNKDINTKNIDGLAEDGVSYNNSFCPFPVCTPSRYSLLTGTYVHQHLGWTNHSTILPSFSTIPGILRENGFYTKAVGKMHFTPTYLDVGFSEMLLAEQNGPGRHDDDYHRDLRKENLCDDVDLIDQVQEFRKSAPDEYWNSFGAMESNLKQEHHSTTWIGDRAVDELSNWKDGGHLLMVGFIKPHHPFDPPAPWSQMYDPEELTLLPGWTESVPAQDLNMHKGYFPNNELTEKKLKRIMAYYYASISQMDCQVGRMVSMLKKNNLYDNTMIIYTSDHGDYMGYHHMVLKNNYMYDPLMKVPLIIKYPHQKQKGRVSNDLVNNIDLTVTILKQAGCKIDKSMKGVDIFDDTCKRDYIFAERGHGLEYMVRSHDRKLLLHKDDEKNQFFNLDEDPCELNNLYNDSTYKDEINMYKMQLLDWMLFEAPSPLFVEEGAKVISGFNVPDSQDGHREESAKYFRDNLHK